MTRKAIYLLIFIVCLFIDNVATASSVQMFGISNDPFIGNYHACYLDKYILQLNKLNDDIHNQDVSLKRRSSQLQFLAEHKDILSNIANNYTCSYQAQELGIKRLPAIVFDDKYVVYGSSDLSTAKRLLNYYKRYNS